MSDELKVKHGLTSLKIEGDSGADPFPNLTTPSNRRLKVGSYDEDAETNFQAGEREARKF